MKIRPRNPFISFVSRYSLSLVLFCLFALSWLGQGLSEFQEFKHEQAAHLQAVTGGEFMVRFFSATFENWQSEFLQLFAMVLLTSFLIHKGSPQSKDSSEKMERAIERIEQKVDRLAGREKLAGRL